MAQARAVVRALDEAGDVGPDHIAAVEQHHAKLGFERREGIVGHLGPRRADPAQQSGLARVRRADDAHVGQQLELQVQPALLARLAVLRDARGLVDGRAERSVAAAAAAGPRDQRLLARLGQIRQQKAGLDIARHGPDGHAEDQILALGAGLVLAAAGRAVGRAVVNLLMKRQQRADVGGRLQIHVAAPASVAAARPAARHVRLAAKRHHAVAAVAGLDKNPGLIQEHPLPPRPQTAAICARIHALTGLVKAFGRPASLTHL
ncbi:MAG: hypothetical protein BWY52_03316 [Chloroflexi bacterium ADurb.Bin325]|nr:MAG: hypothetical protein BWY52_03316 [Chloroflexi bacterium ADurb.Bin325]